MSILKILYVLNLFTGFAAGDPAVARLELPNTEALGRWRDVPGYATAGGLDPFALPRIESACAEADLFPAHPQQDTKVYYIYQTSQYDQSKLTAEAPSCLRGATAMNSKGRKACLRADYAHYVVLSDIYRDNCGGVFRAFWEISFLNRDDNMGMLFSKGRVLFQKPNMGHVLEMYVAGTYAVPRKEFLFLSPVSDVEVLKADRLKESALKTTHQMDARGLLFIVR